MNILPVRYFWLSWTYFNDKNLGLSGKARLARAHLASLGLLMVEEVSALMLTQGKILPPFI